MESAGFNAATGPVIALDFANSYNGLSFNTGSARSGMSGLAVVRSSGNGITLNAGEIALLLNQIGVDLSGADAGNAQDGIYIASTSNNNRIGSNPNSASNYFSNPISGNGANGLHIEYSNNITVQANFSGGGAGNNVQP